MLLNLSQRQPCRFRKMSRQGSASTVFALLLPILLGIAGIAIDMGNMYMTHTKLQATADAAALAGSLELPYDPDLSKGLVRKAAEDMVKTNMDGASIKSVEAGTDVRSVEVTVQADVDMMLMSVLGIANSAVEASATAGYNKLEVVFVIDNSGSMKGTPINLVKQASIELAELLIPDSTQADNKVGLVAFRGKVRIGAGVDGQEAGCRNADGSVNKGLHEDFMDDYQRLSYYYRRNVQMDTCSDLPEAMPLSNNKQQIINSINTQTATGAWSGTVIPEGIKWGRHILTPEAPYTEGSGDEDYRKVMIVLTDGDTEDGECGGSYRASYRPNNYWTNAYFGMGRDDAHCENGGVLNADMLNEAQLAKDAGIEIFAIRFGYSDNVDKDLMRAIASNTPGTEDHYYDAPSVYDIPDIFKQIGKQLGWRLL